MNTSPVAGLITRVNLAGGGVQAYLQCRFMGTPFDEYLNMSGVPMNRHQPFVLATGIVATTLALAACGSDNPEAEPSPTEVTVKEYGSVTDLKDAAVAAGYECKSWAQSNHVTAAAQSGSCSDADVFSTYLSETAVQDNVEGMKSFGEIHLLVGPNWIINVEQPALDMLAEGLGGTVVEYAS